MGINSVIWVVGDVTDSMAADLVERSTRIYGVENAINLSPDQYPKVWSDCLLDRYYGPNYERGNWPAIYGKIRLVQYCCSGCVVKYGMSASEIHDYAAQCTPEYLECQWSLWLKDDRQPYLRTS